MDLLEHGREATKRGIHFFLRRINHINFSLCFSVSTFHSLHLFLVELLHNVYFSNTSTSSCHI
ncbi:hypothetical protein LguiA_006369 [Lonicera macranthoides]